MKSLAVKAAHVVPFFSTAMKSERFYSGTGPHPFNGRAIRFYYRPKIKKRFDTYYIVIIPVDRKESLIVRWQVEVILSDIKNSRYLDIGPYYGRDLHQKELTFRNEKRPVSRFIYFYFLISLIRIKDIKRKGWEEV